MKVWVIHNVGIAGSQLVGVEATLVDALKQMTDDTATAVEIEVGKDYTDVTKYVMVTAQRRVPKMIENRPTFLKGN